MIEERFEVSYRETGVEKEILYLSGKVIESAKVVHEGAEGHVTLRFADGVVRRFGYNDLAFWEEA